MSILFSARKLVNLCRYCSTSSVDCRKKEALLHLLREMPKNTTDHIVRMQTQRQIKKVAKSKYPPSTVTLQVLGSGAKGAPASLYIFTDQSCFLFNCGEGTQRLAAEHKFKLAKVENMFFTHTSWKNVGGLPGVALTLQDSGCANISLHGPPRLEELFAAASRFIILNNLNVSYVDATCPGSFFEDSVMKIEYVPIMSTNITRESDSISPVGEEDSTNYYINRLNTASSDALENSAPKRLKTNGDSDPVSGNSKAALAYICRLHPKQGTLLPEKCFELGVPPGPLYGQLKNGEDVTLSCGRSVRASDVRTPDDAGPVFLVVECPDESYLEDFLSQPQLLKLRQVSGASELESPQVIVHFTPIELTKHEKYQQWIQGFSSGTRHLMLGRSNNEEDQQRGLGSIAIHRIQHQLNQLEPTVFPILPYDMQLGDDQDTAPSHECSTLSTFQLRPNKKTINLSLVPRIKIQEYIDETHAVEGFSESLEALKETLSKSTSPLNQQFPKITFFGTGSCIPNKTRNTSAILVELEADRYMLMDCGEGTYGQMVRFFGLEKSIKVLSNLVAVYISHLHADHHLGLFGLLQGRQYSLKQLGATEDNHEPILLIAPHQISYWLKMYHLNFESIRSGYELVPAVALMPKATTPPSDGSLSRLNLQSIATCYVQHCPNAFGLSFTTSDGFKVTYSGDTMPCQALVDLGLDSDLLIHEATMEDGMEMEAEIKTHSTISQAVEVGRLMKSKFTILTHFSQRYAKIPLFTNELVESFGGKVAVAFDNMQVSPDVFYRLVHFVPALKLMFADHCEEMVSKTVKRQKRLLRLQEHVTKTK